jgi:hypothetical protein
LWRGGYAFLIFNFSCDIFAAVLCISIMPKTYASAIAAWTQMKRHNELAQSYALAAQELEELEAVATNQISGNAFTQLVEQAENSISREHTLWCARRDIPLIKVTGINPKVRG